MSTAAGQLALFLTPLLGFSYQTHLAATTGRSARSHNFNPLRSYGTIAP